MYTPSPQILHNYANILVNFALNSGQGIQHGDVVHVRIPETARPLLGPLTIAILQAGWHPMIDLIPEWGQTKLFFEHASDEQLTRYADRTMKAKIEDADHLIVIIADENPHELSDIDPKKMMLRQKAGKVYRELRDTKENQGKFTWTLALYGTEAMAQEANMTLEQYREQIINACFLNESDPIAKWKEVFAYQETIKAKLNALKIQSVHLTGEDIDLTVKIGSDRQWLGWSGRNIPSFELFVSPDRRGTQWRVRFSEPLYHYGKLIKGTQLRFENWLITKASATEGEEMLLEMISAENANKIGEFSLTDKRLSRITRFMADTLYDENVGWQYGNTHIAVGNAYKDSYIGDPSSPTPAQRAEMWFNESVVHTDIVSTTNRTVTATLENGSQVVIYKDGEFIV